MQAATPDAGALSGKNILITGASRGIGRAVAAACARSGATTILLARNLSFLESLAAEITSTTPQAPAPLLYPFNLVSSPPQAYQTFADTLAGKISKLDGLIFNAGMLGQFAPLEHYPIETWFQVFQLNLHSQFLLLQALLPLLKASSSASICFTAIHEDATSAYAGAYSIAQQGLLALAELLRTEHRQLYPQLRYNHIRPARCNTQLQRHGYPGVPVEALAAAEELTGAYLYLMSDASQQLNGVTLEASEQFQ